MKLPKKLAKQHAEALKLVRAGRPLSIPEREFVLTHYHEGAEHMNCVHGAFFTPLNLARDFRIEIPECRRILDLCAGIGALTNAAEGKAEEYVCVELNPNYVEAGRAAVPFAEWVCASAFDVQAYAHLGPFDVVISNPPFGRIPAPGFEGKYTGPLFEYKLIELAKQLGARDGVFILPQESAPFSYSGRQGYLDRSEDERPRRFREQTGIRMQPNCGIDTATYRGEWRGVAPLCEIVVCDFEEEAEEASPEERRQTEMPF